MNTPFKMGGDDEKDGNARPEKLEELSDLNNQEEENNKSNINDHPYLYDKIYSRPPVDPTKVNDHTDFYFMQLDIDYFCQTTEIIEEEDISQPQVKAREADIDSLQEPIIRMYGVTKDQNSVLVNIKGMVPYLFVQLPLGINPTQENLENIQNELNKQGELHFTVKSNLFVKKLELIQGESIKYYKGQTYKPETFLKIYVQIPSYLSVLREIFEKGFAVGEFRFPNLTFESNIPFELRYMIDSDIVGMGWVKLDKNTFSIRDTGKHRGRCQIEIDIDYQHVHGMETMDPEWGYIAPLRILSFHIECLSKSGELPQVSEDPIIQISTVLKIHDQSEDLVRTVFTINSCSNIPGCIVKSFDTEAQLLIEWESFVQNVDPDIYLGYNITNFDFPYILERGKKLGLNNGRYGEMGRIKSSITKIKECKFVSKAMGMRETKEMNIEGRIQMDMLLHMQREIKLNSYELNQVSIHVLNEQKEDLHQTQIQQLQEGDAESRNKIAACCLQNSILALKLMQKLMCICNYTEMARVTGVPLNYLFLRGQQIKVISKIYRQAKHYGLLIPTEIPQEQNDKYEGAIILEPKKGFYDKPIATLGFTSMYPSIMIAHNLCYSCLIPKSVADTMKEEDKTLTPHGDYFVKPHIRQGVLPDILKELLDARNTALNELNKEIDSLRRSVLEGRQVALKILTNSIYEFTGAQAGQLPCLEISSSVTAFGRQMMEHTRDFVLQNYTVKNGFQYDAEVIYCDTDSIMIKFGCDTVEEAMKYGKDAAELITKSLFICPIKLEFQKVYYPFILLNKKKYAGCQFTKADDYDKVDMTGLESTRRGNVMPVRQILETCFRFIIKENKEEGLKRAIEYIKGCASDAYQSKDVSKLETTKSLNKKQENEEQEETNQEENNKSNCIQKSQGNDNEKCNNKIYTKGSQSSKQLGVGVLETVLNLLEESLSRRP